MGDRDVAAWLPGERIVHRSVLTGGYSNHNELLVTDPRPPGFTAAFTAGFTAVTCRRTGASSAGPWTCSPSPTS
ncbi:hypothetical protein [Dactylosporangium sp. NPDC051541]|uniref:hypothetical protein n=1 Tax=Dactylosporangium sp. NPDC051541 TaxID=3363977 RepID=UPI00379DA03B